MKHTEKKIYESPKIMVVDIQTEARLMVSSSMEIDPREPHTYEFDIYNDEETEDQI